MSRSLGNRARAKRRGQSSGCEAEGRQLFEQGQPCPPRSSARGKDHARWRGWQRAAAARTGAKAVKPR